MSKTIIIIDPKGGRLGNQLWNYISVFAYCLEKGYECQNYSFYKYEEDFNLKNKTLNYHFLLLLNKITRILHINRVTHYLYRNWVEHVKSKYSEQIIDSEKITYLLPTQPELSDDIYKNRMIENSIFKKIYLTGWTFRNPIGLEKYQDKIRNYFSIKDINRKYPHKLITDLKPKFAHIVGVHIRQGDYRKHLNGELFFNELEVSKILRDYLLEFKKDNDETCFIICSDEKIDQSIFNGLNIIVSSGNTIEDLYLLSQTDLIIGSNSTFGAFASYYGNIPMIVFEKEIDWNFYSGKQKYFDNKKCTMVYNP